MPALSVDNDSNRRLFSIPFNRNKVSITAVTIMVCKLEKWKYNKKLTLTQPYYLFKLLK